MNKIKNSFAIVLKFFLKNYFLRVFKVRYIMKDFNPKREGPYFLIGNHVLPLDAFFSSFAIKGYGILVASSFVFMNFFFFFSLKNLIDTIVKRKGQSDIKTIRDIRKYVKQGHVIQVYPSGNTSYYGNPTKSVYSTAKLFKLQKIDVVCAKTKGGYFAKPRWRNHRAKKAYLEIEMFTLFKGEDLKDMSVEDIYLKMVESYDQNDYEWNRERKIKYKGKNLLEGSHTVIYACPECRKINHINSKGNTIYCEKCGSIGTIDDYGFINGTKFDNFVDWGTFQEKLLKQNLDKRYEFNVKLNKLDLDNYKKNSYGEGKLIYDNGEFYVERDNGNWKFDIGSMTGVVYTERDEFSFDYHDETYMFISEKPKLLLDLVTFKKEELYNF